MYAYFDYLLHLTPTNKYEIYSKKPSTHRVKNFMQRACHTLLSEFSNICFSLLHYDPSAFVTNSSRIYFDNK